MSAYLKYLFLFTCWCLSLSVYSQKYNEGYIITLSNDTINGQIKSGSYQDNFYEVTFRSSGTSTAEVYTTKNIRGFGTSKNVYVSGLDSTLFSEALVSGKISLFKTPTIYIVEKNGERYRLEPNAFAKNIENERGYKNRVLVEDNRWRGTLTLLINDCYPNASTTTSYMKYNQQALTKLITKYNACSGVQYTEHKEEIPWLKVKYGLAVGFVNTDLVIDEIEWSDSKVTLSSSDAVFGGYLMFYAPRISERVSIGLEFMLGTYSFEETAIRSGIRGESIHDLYFEYRTLSIPVLFNYSIPLNKWRMGMDVGFNYQNHLDASAIMITRQFVGQEVEDPEPEIAIDIDKSHMGFVTGMGLYRKLGKVELGLRLRYSMSPDINRPGKEITTHRYGIQFTVGAW